MKLSTKVRYGTRALLELALRHEEKLIKLKEISKKQQISLSYLEQIIAPLIAGGVVRTIKGPKGGIYLAKSAEDIKLKEIIQLFEGSLAPVECINDPNICERSTFCVTRDIWGELEMVMDEFLKATTLQDLVERHRKKQKTEPSLYYT